MFLLMVCTLLSLLPACVSISIPTPSNNSSGNSIPSTNNSITPPTIAPGIAPPPPSLPPAPLNLICNLIEKNKIILQWQDNSNNEDGFEIYRNGSTVGKTKANVTNFQDDNLELGKSYQYIVKSFNIVGYSEASTYSVNIPLPIPSVPSGFSAQIISPDSVTLVWSDNSDNEDGFTIFRDGNVVSNVSKNLTTFQDNNLTAGKSYQYGIKSYNPSGTSDMVTCSVAIPIPPPVAPSSLTTQEISGNTAVLTWMDNSNNEDGFKIYRDGNLVGNVTAGVTFYRDSALQARTTYQYLVKAFNSGGESDCTTCVVKTQNPPLNVRIDKIGVINDHDDNIDIPIIGATAAGDILIGLRVSDGIDEHQVDLALPRGQDSYQLNDYQTMPLGITVFSVDSVGDFLQFEVFAIDKDTGTTTDMLLNQISQVPKMGKIAPILGGLFIHDDSVGSYYGYWGSNQQWGIGQYNKEGNSDFRIWFTIWSDKEPENKYSLNILSNPTDKGTVTVSPSSADGRYSAGTIVTLTAAPTGGNKFDFWSGDISGTNIVTTLTMDADKTVTANFAAAIPKIPVVPPPVTSPPNWGGILAPKEGATIASNNIFVQLDYSKLNIVAPSSTNKQGEGHVVFYLDVYPLPTSTGQKADQLPSGSIGKVFVGSTATIDQQMGYQWRSIPNGEHIFGAQLVQNDGSPFNPPLFAIAKVKVDGPFPDGKPPSPVPLYSITVTTNPTGAGTINLSPVPTGGYPSGIAVTLTATPFAGYRFSSWSGDVSGTNPVITLTMNANKAVVANFATIPSILPIYPSPSKVIVPTPSVLPIYPSSSKVVVPKPSVTSPLK